MLGKMAFALFLAWGQLEKKKKSFPAKLAFLKVFVEKLLEKTQRGDPRVKRDLDTYQGPVL